MKKLLLSLLILGAVSLSASAQTMDKKVTPKKTKVETPHTETKIKKTSTAKQKAHNLVHPKHKKYNGVKVKREVKKPD